MSDPTIYIALQGTTRHVRPRYTPPGSAARAPRPPRDPRVHGAVFRIPHTPYGIRNSEIGIRKPGYRKSSWCGIFPLDHDGDGAVGCAHRRMVRWCNERNAMSPIEILCEMVRLHDLGIRPQVVRGMWREEKEWEFAIEQARQRVREWNNLIEGVKVGQ